MTDLNRERRRRWAAALIRKGRESGVTVTYGSDEWHRLPQDHPARIAAVVVAAETYATEGDELPERLAAELAAGRRADADLEAESFVQMAASVRRRAGSPSFAELEHRRGVISTEQLVEWERQSREFVSGRTEVRPSLPGRTA